MLRLAQAVRTAEVAQMVQAAKLGSSDGMPLPQSVDYPASVLQFTFLRLRGAALFPGFGKGGCFDFTC
jgi:hypothetical protein